MVRSYVWQPNGREAWDVGRMLIKAHHQSYAHDSWVNSTGHQVHHGRGQHRWSHYDAFDALDSLDSLSVVAFLYHVVPVWFILILFYSAYRVSSEPLRAQMSNVRRRVVENDVDPDTVYMDTVRKGGHAEHELAMQGHRGNL